MFKKSDIHRESSKYTLKQANIIPMTRRNQVLEFSYEHFFPLSSVDLNSSFIWQYVWSVIDHEVGVVRYVSLTAGDNYTDTPILCGVQCMCWLYLLLFLFVFSAAE